MSVDYSGNQKHETIDQLEDVKQAHFVGGQDEDAILGLKIGAGDSANMSGARVQEVFNAELFAAIKESPIEKWSKASIHLYYSVFVAFCCACANGYDGSLMTALIAMSPFQKTFNTGGDLNESVIFSLYTVGAIVGAPLAAILSDRYGRRKSMFAGGAIIIIGSIIGATASHIAQLVVARFILGFGIAVMTVAAPAYSIEVAPPHWRGRATGFYNCGWFGGSIPAAAITYGTNFIDTNRAWQIPLILQCFACVIVMGSVWFIPESPRYLMANGREEEAIDFLVHYHGNGNRQSKLVALEVYEMREGIKLDGIDKRWWDYRPIFGTHNGRWRMAQVLMISIFGQFSGNGLGYFNTQIYAQLGVSSVPQQLGYNLLSSVVSAIGALSAVSLTDIMPRRKVLVIGTFVCALALATNSGLSAAMANQVAQLGAFKPAYAKGALAAYFLFGAIYSFTYTPLQGVIPAEALETTMRAKGLAASGVIVNCIGFINAFAGPVGLKNLGYKYIYVFVGWDVIESLLWYLFCVESQGRTLEELEQIYNDPNPVKASLRRDKIVVQADGNVSEKVQV